MRKTILVIGAAIGLSMAIVSSIQAEMLDVEIVELVQPKDFVDSKFEIALIAVPEVENGAYLTELNPVKQVNSVITPLMTTESTKLDSLLLAQVSTGTYTARSFEVGWRA